MKVLERDGLAEPRVALKLALDAHHGREHLSRFGARRMVSLPADYSQPPIKTAQGAARIPLVDDSDVHRVRV